MNRAAELEGGEERRGVGELGMRMRRNEDGSSRKAAPTYFNISDEI